MKEDYISFNTAKLAKERGFSLPVLAFYYEDGDFKENKYSDINNMDYGFSFTIDYSELIENWNDKWLTKKNGNRCFGCSNRKDYFDTFSAPTQSLLQKWLREKHNIVIVLDLDSCATKTKPYTYIYDKYVFTIARFGIDFEQGTEFYTKKYNTYEEALEEGLVKALELI